VLRSHVPDGMACSDTAFRRLPLMHLSQSGRISGSAAHDAGNRQGVCLVTAIFALTLPMNANAPAAAREFVAAATCPDHRTRAPEAGALLVTEVVTNAVRYGRAPVSLQVECCASEGMRIRVSDAEPAVPVVRAVGTDAEGGRGMALVDLLSREWGVWPQDGGNAVWFRLWSEHLLTPAVLVPATGGPPPRGISGRQSSTVPWPAKHRYRWTAGPDHACRLLSVSSWVCAGARGIHERAGCAHRGAAGGA